MSLVAWFQGQTANRMGLLHNSILQKLPLSKNRNSGGNHEIIVVSTAKILGCFSKKAILQQPLFLGGELHFGETAPDLFL